MSNYLPTEYQTFIALSRYARWLPDHKRRENWGETVERYMTSVVLPSLVRNTDYPNLLVRLLTVTTHVCTTAPTYL
jgi:hypothetical protein